MSNHTNNPKVELRIEFIVELVMFLYPYGAEQMGLPHNFYFGLACWAIGTAIAIRMFWIFPVWSQRLTKLEKTLFSVLFIILLTFVFYKPVTAAYRRINEITEVTPPNKRELGPEQKPAPQPLPVVTPTVNSSKPKPRKAFSGAKAQPSQDGATLRSGNDNVSVGAITQGPCSNLQVGGSNNQATTNCQSFPLEFTAALRIIPSNEGYTGSDKTSCPIKTQVVITPNQAVPPPIEMALDFDNPISSISAVILGAAAMMRGGPYRLGNRALTSIQSPGIRPKNPMIVEVCSAQPVRLIDPPHLENE